MAHSWDFAINDEAVVYSATVPHYKGLCGTVECYLRNPAAQQEVKVRALLDSGANVPLIEQQTAKHLGLTGRKQFLCLNVARGSSSTKEVQEVSFQIRSMDGYITTEMAGIVTGKVGNPFQPIDFDPRKRSYLNNIELADKFPTPNPRPIQVLLSEPYFSQYR
ncbi:Hypothetical protein FKW44_015631 [Caligus rogercresseyi]|uniref:Peptidase A2 domain-containing protein n=1 Tax=Caligus rogercresseyi TaxID=217165 RepID=A0A7T8H0P1_CALRO|nr:Hypothetical protein FKW44_015631 [Caligus rogercresseyi]